MGKHNKIVTPDEMFTNFADLLQEEKIFLQEKQYRKQLCRNYVPENQTLDEIIDKQKDEMKKKKQKKRQHEN